MPAPFQDRLRRLATFHNALASAYAESKDGVSSLELLLEVGCQRKALYRLGEDLRELGAPLSYSDASHLWSYLQAWNFPVQPIVTLHGPVGIRLAMDFLLDPSLERDLQGCLAIDPDLKRSAGGTLPRLTGKFSTRLLGPLARALKERRVVRFQYRKPADTNAKGREVHPLEFFEWDGMPYLQAHDPIDVVAPFKRFALARIDHLEVLDAKFKPPPKSQIPSCLGAFCGKILEAVIEVDAAQAPYVRERQWHPKQRLRDSRDGKVEFTLPFGDADEAARWILGRGPGFRPVSPPLLVTAWQAAIKGLGG